MKYFKKWYTINENDMHSYAKTEGEELPFPSFFHALRFTLRYLDQF